MRFSYCPKCGGKLSLKVIGDEGQVPYCDTCKFPLFDIMTPCSIMLCFIKDKIVLAHDRNHKDKYVLLAGYTKMGETLEECAIREVKEEIGLDYKSIKYISSYYQESRENLMAGFVLKLKEDNINLSDELLDLKLVSIDEALYLLKNSKIAYKLLNDYLNTL